jgi:predicted ATPase
MFSRAPRPGALDEGLATVTGALERADDAGAHLWDAEFHRLHGELLLARDPGDVSQAEAAFRQALVIAGRQEAKSWELRAAVSLGHLWCRHGKRGEAGRLVRGIHNRFTEGFDTQDLRDAKTLLDELA